MPGETINTTPAEESDKNEWEKMAEEVQAATLSPENDTPKHTAKNEEAEKKNAGDHVNQQELNQDVTPPTTIEQVKENFKSINEQQEQDEANQDGPNREERARIFQQGDY